MSNFWIGFAVGYVTAPFVMGGLGYLIVRYLDFVDRGSEDFWNRP